MPVFVDPKTGERFENYDDDAAEKAQQLGLVASEAYDAEQRSGGFASQVKTAGEEAIRQGASLIPGVDAGAAPVGLTELEPGQEGNALTDVYSPEARERRAVNPGAAGIGAAAPAVAASLLLPGAGALGLAATIGVDAASGYAQEAADAEIENRGISGADVLRNAGLNLAFSLPLYGLGEAARVAMQGKRLSALERAAGTAKDTAGSRAAAAEGADLAQAVSDPAVQADLIDRVSTNASEAVARAQGKLEGLAPAVVARNPRAQREAVGAIADVMRTADPELAARLDGLTKGSARSRLKGLREIRDELAAAGDSDALAAIDATVGREDLWGSKAIRGAADVDSVLGAIPDGTNPEALIEYAANLRKVRDGEFAGIADEIEQLAERQIEIRTASAVGDVTPQAVDDVVDYRKAMSSIDPSEAWRLTHDGADEGLRKLEATSVSDAFQRADDVFREDAGLAVKREDFVKGAESWTPAVIAKQGQWAAERLGKLEQLAADLAGAERQGRNLGGFRAEATGHIDRALQRIRGGDPITANLEFDQLKRNLDGVGKRLAASPAGSIDDASKAWGSRAILDVSDDLRKGLEDSELWGRNAGLQKETNAAWANIIEPYSRVTKQMAELLSRDFGVVGGAGVRRRFDPDMIESLMSRGYQRNLRKDIADALKGLDQMAQARQSKGLSRLDRLSQMRADLVRIQQGFDFADLLAVAKGKAKAPIGLEIAGRLADSATPGGGLIGSVAGPLAARAKGAYTQGMPMLAPGSKSPLAAAVRRHLGLSRSEQAAMLADPAFYERLPGSLQKQLMGGSAAGERAVEMASAAADAAKRDRDLTVRLMVNPADAKRARKAMRKPTPAIERAKSRARQSGHTVIGKRSTVGKSAAGKVEKLAAQRDSLPVSKDLPLISREAQDKLDEATDRAWARLSHEEKDAVSAYAGGDYSELRALQKGEQLVTDAPWYVERMTGNAKHLQTAEGKLAVRNPTSRGPLYRAIPLDDSMLDELLNHDEFVTSASTSSSYNPAIAKTFGGAGDRVLFRIDKLDKGASLMGSAGAGEAEILIPKGQKFKITSRSRLDDGTVVIQVEQVGKASADDMRDLGALGSVAFNKSGKSGDGPNFSLGDVAKSPVGVGTGAAGAAVAYHHLAEPKQPDPESMTPLQRFSDGYDRPSDAFRAARKMIRDWQGNPEALVDMIAGHVGDVGQLSPKLEREMTAQAMRIAGYLQDNLPGQRNVSVVYPDGTPPSSAEVRQFALRFGAAVDPAGVMADARMGRLERTQLDTLYAVWPQEYDALRSGVIQELGTGRATTQTRQRMSLLFSFGSEIDPALGPRTRAVVAAARGAQEEKAPAPSSPGMNRQKLPSTANMQPAGMAALSLGQQIGP